MRLNDHGKLIMLLAILVAVTVLALAGVLDADSVKLVLATELGYITGNGVLAKRKQTPSPVITYTDD